MKEFIKVMKALSDPNRVKIIKMLQRRVLCVCALGRDVTAAQAESYAACDRIGWEGAWRRNDIGYRAIQRERAA